MKVINYNIRVNSSKLTCIAAAFLIATSSCNEKELLNPQPETSLQAGEAFASPTRVLGQVNGMYSALKHANFLGGRYVMLADIRGEE